MNNKSRTYDYLVTHGIRPSAQRIAVMEYLMQNHTHPTADEILEGLRESMPTISRMTIYNTLNTLTEKGAILSLDIDPKNTHFDGNKALHAHSMCDVCGHIYDTEIARTEELTKLSARGFNIRDTQLLFKGTCEKCKKEGNN